MGYELIAAVDLGSNSFRLQIGRIVGDQVYPLDGIKEPVRLASGLTADRCLDTAARQRALVALSRFGERLRGFAPDAVRAVATNTFRVAKDVLEFLVQAERALGFPIEIIAGREEARLIYLGAVHSLPAVDHERLVIDIGGGSTEFIIGRRLVPELMESLYMGCVSFTQRYFPEGRIEKKRMREAQTAAAKEIQGIAHEYRSHGWQEAIGSSGSARSIADILELNAFNSDEGSGLTRVGLMRLQEAMLKAGHIDALDLVGVRSDRLPVLPGGVAIMLAVFEELGIERMTYADGALRLGVLYDLLGRYHHHDMRDATVLQFMQRYQVDQRQAERVAATAASILVQLRGHPTTVEQEHDVQFLVWAAKLHEIGISVAHNGYHKHGAYILTFADMPGFSKKDQARLALFVFGHRGKLQKVTALPAGDSNWELILALRLSVLLHRSRDGAALPGFKVKTSDERFILDLQAGWLDDHPLTAMALEEETLTWERAEFALQVRESSKLGGT